MGKYVYLLFMAIIGFSISVFSFHKGFITLSEINEFLYNDKSFYDVFIKPKQSNYPRPSKEKSYLDRDNYRDVKQPCYKLSGAGLFIQRYLDGIIDINKPLSEQVRKIKHFSSSHPFIEQTFNISTNEETGNKQLQYLHVEDNCETKLHSMSSLVFTVASISSKREIKRLSKFIAHPFENHYEYHNTIVSYPFVFYFANGDFSDFKYINTKDSHRAVDHLNQHK